MASRLRAAALALACLGTQSAQAAPPAAEVFFRDPDFELVAISPSGRQLAVTSVKGLERPGLAVVDLAPGNRITRVAQFSNGDIYHFAWLDDSRLLFSVGDVANTRGRLSAPPAIYAANIDGSDLRQVATWRQHLLRVPTPLPGKANDRVLMARPTGTDGEMTPVWVNTRKELVFSYTRLNAPPHAVDWMTDSSGEARVAFTRDKGRQAAYWRAPGSTTWARLYESGLLTVPFQIEDVDDAGGLYVTRSGSAEGHHWLTRYDFRTGQPESKFIVETPGFDFDGTMVTEDGGGKTLGVRVVVDGETTVWFDAQMKALQDRLDERLPGRVNRITCRRCGEPDMVAVVRSYSDHDPGHLYLYQARPPEGEKAWRSIGAVMDGIEPDQMASMSLHRIQARDGRDLPVWLTRPDAASGPLPAVVLLHGGPWQRGSFWGWHAMPQFLASRGYLVIEPEFRGSTGYGTAHFRAGFKQWGQAMQNDVADALRWAQAQGLASSKACVTGESYGGYSTLMGLVNDPDLFRCGIAGFAPTDLDLMVGGSWWVSDDVGPAARNYTLPELVGDAEKDAAMLAAQSPVKQAARIKAAVMLVFSERDRRVPLAHGERMRSALRKAGNEPVWVTYDDEAHGLANMNNRVDYARRLEAFLARYLKP
jgi:dipeptidyl aminopeptidase/acylaminoacyl peptidase